MILSRSPLRITLGGGGTDDPRFVVEHSGYCLTAAISKHVYVGISRIFGEGYRLRYSQDEHVATIDEIRHPIIREALRYHAVGSGVEVVTLADIPSGTGLGSSGAFTVALCDALATYMGEHLHQEELAERAAHIELGVLGRPGGAQDHYASALGGVRALGFHAEGSVTTDDLGLDADIMRRLDYGLRLYFTGYSRDAYVILSTQSREGLEEIKAQGILAAHALQSGDLAAFAADMNEHWEVKKRRLSAMTSSVIDHFYDVALANGALGGKLVGAGGGGFLLFYTEDPKRLSMALATEGLREMDFSFDRDGVKTIVSER